MDGGFGEFYNGCFSMNNYSFSGSAGKIPNCIFGDCKMGIINDENNHQHIQPYCECWSGYQHDFLLGRYHNCGMPVKAPMIATSIAASFNLLALMFGIYVAYGCERNSDAMKLTFASSLSSGCFFVGNIIIIYNKYITQWYAAIFINFGMTSLCLAFSIIIQTALKPVAIFMNVKHVEWIEVVIIKFIPTILLLSGLLCTLVGHVIGTSESISRAIAICFIIISICSTCFLPTIKFLGDLIVALDDAAKIDAFDEQPRMPRSFWENFSVTSSYTNATQNNRSSMFSSTGAMYPSSYSSHDHTSERRTRLRLSQKLITIADKFRASLVKSRPQDLRNSTNVSNGNMESGLIRVPSEEELAIRKVKLLRASKRAKLLKFRFKVSVMRAISAVGCTALIVFSLAAGIVDLVYLTLPFSGFFFFGLSTAMGIFSIQITHYAWNQGKRGRKKKSNQKKEEKHQNSQSKRTYPSEVEKHKVLSSNVAAVLGTQAQGASKSPSYRMSVDGEIGVVSSNMSLNANENDKTGLIPAFDALNTVRECSEECKKEKTITEQDIKPIHV